MIFERFEYFKSIAESLTGVTYSNRRLRDIVMMRKLITWGLYNSGYTTNRIEVLGSGFDHSTCLYNIRKVRECLKSKSNDPELNSLVLRLQELTTDVRYEFEMPTASKYTIKPLHWTMIKSTLTASNIFGRWEINEFDQLFKDGVLIKEHDSFKDAKAQAEKEYTELVTINLISI